MNCKEFQRNRVSLGFTQEELARKLHVKYWTLVKWENGSPIPDCVQYLFHLLYNVPYVPKDISNDDTLDLPFD